MKLADITNQPGKPSLGDRIDIGAQAFPDLFARSEESCIIDATFGITNEELSLGHFPHEFSTVFTVSQSVPGFNRRTYRRKAPKIQPTLVYKSL